MSVAYLSPPICLIRSSFRLIFLSAQIQTPRISYLPLLLPDIKRHLVEIVLDDPSVVKEEEWWFEESGTGTIMKWRVALLIAVLEQS